MKFTIKNHRFCNKTTLAENVFFSIFCFGRFYLKFLCLDWSHRICALIANGEYSFGSKFNLNNFLNSSTSFQNIKLKIKLKDNSPGP